VLQVGFGYAFVIVLALVICASTSGGHFNPCVTIAFVIFRGFPPLKAVRYIAAQIFGAYVACLLAYAQYKDLIKEVTAGLQALGLFNSIMFTPQGPAGIFALYVTPGSNLGRVFLNEFVTDTVVAIAIWACIDPTNFLVPPAAAPWVIGFVYAVAIWGFSPVGLAINSGRDVGGRLAAISIWGTRASGGHYAALAALTNIPAMLLGVVIYEFFLVDSGRVMPTYHVEYMNAHKLHHDARARELGANGGVGHLDQANVAHGRNDAVGVDEGLVGEKAGDTRV